MPIYRAPIADIAHALNAIAGFDEALRQGRFGELSMDLVEAVLEEAGRFASEEIAPLGKAGDLDGAVLENGRVTMPPGWKELYASWVAGGWNGIAGPQEYGGQNLPQMVALATLEMWNSGSMAFAIGPTLTMGAIEALEKHGSQSLKSVYLEKLVSGEWMGTMQLTEPHAGSDLSTLKTRAEPQDDGTYRLFGQKIFITYGEHDLTENIIHFVLARLPDAPAGTRGLSLFLVPKFLPDEAGNPAIRNDVLCHSLEHKLGLHGSPTCTMIHGDGRFGEKPGAVGWLVGEENRGLACMFTMMNNARLAVGIQGVAVAEAAFQLANAYAHERRQGKASGHTGEGMAPIVMHPDVRRNLLTMKALTQAARAIAYRCAHAIDMAEVHDGTERDFWKERANLLTPLAKAFPTDIGFEVASLGIQVHGGMGYIEETGAAALLRDARIAQIYEGTNGIQSIDLVTRKLTMSDGAHVAGFVAELRRDADTVRASNRPAFGAAPERLAASIEELQLATDWLLDAMRQDRMDAALAGATPYLRLMSLVAAGVWIARGAIASDGGGRIELARFFAENMIGTAAALRQQVTQGADSLAAAAGNLDN